MAFNFNEGYNRSNFINFLRTDLFGDKFVQNYVPIKPERKTAFFVENGIFQLGTVQLGSEEVFVIEIRQSSKNDPRVTLTQDTFKLMGDLGIDNAIVALYVDDNSSWRFSLLTTKYEDFKKTTSNPKRYSFILGPNEKVRTVNQQLIKKGEIKDFEDLISRFKVEIVRDEFFDEYLELFVRLYKAIQEDKPFVELLESQAVDIVSFTKNLLGKIVFLYFIQQKGWLGLGKNTTTEYGEGNKNFMRILRDNFKKGETMSTEKTGYFYNDYLEWLFFAGLNIDRRDNDDRFPNLQMKVPYLNGGLFKEEYTGWESYVTKIDNKIFSNVDEKGEDNADGILDIFDRYNFTIDEDSLYDRDIAVDPEMLGRIFEKMISISSKNIDEVVELYDNKKGKGKFNFSNELNKDQGAFYTPREIVHYMTQECLKGYLQNKTKTNIEMIDKLFEIKEKFLLDKKEIEKTGFSADFIVEIDEALKAVKILDPAVGSGAYPMGLLHEISSLRYYIYGAFYDKFGDETKDFLEYNEEKQRDVISMYKIKKDIILNNIYGGDIDPGAIDIAKLRFRLSLVVDEREPEPLPNFEFKFVCANSLIPLADETKERDLFSIGDEPKLATLKQYKKDYYNATSKKSKEDIKNKIIAYTKTESTLFSEPTLRAKQIEEFGKNFDNPKHKHSFFDSSLMLSEWRGFDIIIANPPYIGEKGHKEIFQEVAESKLGKYYLGKMDYFYFFFHLALDLGKNGCQISFITTNYYPTALGARKLRKDFKDRAIIKKLVNFNELKIFESALGQHNIITILQKGQNTNEKCELINVKIKGMMKRNIFYSIINGDNTDTDYNNIPQSELYEGEENYIRLSKEDDNSTLSKILNKIKNNNDVLENICRINNGVHTEADYLTNKKYPLRDDKSKEVGDGIYVLDPNNKNDIDALKQIKNKESNNLKPFFKNSDIKKYYTNIVNQKFLIYINKKNDNIDKLPNIKSHLDKFKTIIQKSSDNAPYLHRPKTQSDFNSEKIVCPQRSPKNTFGYNNCERYASADVYFLTNPNKDYNLKYLLAILNSKLYYIWLYNKGKRKGETLELYQKPLSEIPIKRIPLEEQQPFIDLVDKIIERKNNNPESDTSELETQIDNMIYNLYGLTDEEIKIVENSFK